LVTAQGCQIFTSCNLPNRKKLPKTTQNIPNGLKVHQMAVNIRNGHIVYRSKALQNIPKLIFSVCNHFIWQPCFRFAGSAASHRRANFNMNG
jgi:hypothetical protein